MAFLNGGAESKRSAGVPVFEKRVGAVLSENKTRAEFLNLAFSDRDAYEAEIRRLVALPLPKREGSGQDFNLILTDAGGRTIETVQVLRSFTDTGDLRYGRYEARARHMYAYSEGEEEDVKAIILEQLTQLVATKPKDFSADFILHLVGGEEHGPRMTALSTSGIRYTQNRKGFANGNGK